MIPFGEVISFFGAASFFAWLAFVVFQDEQLTDYKPTLKTRVEHLKNLSIARIHLFTVYDFFLISFACYVIAYVADYFVHLRNGSLLFGVDTYGSPFLYSMIGAFFLLGLLSLALPMAYIRSMSKGTTTPLMVNPPDFFHTFVLFCGGVWNFSTAVSEFGRIQHAENLSALGLWRIFWLISLFISAVGFLVSLREWNADQKTVIENGAMLFLPIISAFVVNYLFTCCGLLKLFN